MERPISKTFALVVWPRVATGTVARCTGGAIVGGVAANHAVVVVVKLNIVTPAEVQASCIADLVVTANKPGEIAGIDFVVVVFSLGERAKAGAVLLLLQVGLAQFHVKAVVQGKFVAALLVERRLHTDAALAIFFKRGAGKKML